MDDLLTQPTQHSGHGVHDAAGVAKLRALARPKFEIIPFVKTISPFEIVAGVGLLLIVAGAVLIYSFWILPDQVRYVQAANQVAENQTKIAELQRKVQDPSSIAAEFNTVKSSLDTFQNDYLRPRQVGRLEIINTVNSLTRETGVRLASPVVFTTAIPGVEETTSSSKSSKSKVSRKSAEAAGTIRTYPSLEMQFSIAGEYGALRAFINRFEASRQFAVINTVSLSVEAEHKGVRGGKRRAVVASPVEVPPGQVTLNITITGYFQPDPESARIIAATER
jgi:hypothetical protein